MGRVGGAHHGPALQGKSHPQHAPPAAESPPSPPTIPRPGPGGDERLPPPEAHPGGARGPGDRPAGKGPGRADPAGSGPPVHQGGGGLAPTPWLSWVPENRAGRLSANRSTPPLLPARAQDTSVPFWATAPAPSGQGTPLVHSRGGGTSMTHDCDKLATALQRKHQWCPGIPSSRPTVAWPLPWRVGASGLFAPSTAQERRSCFKRKKVASIAKALQKTTTRQHRLCGANPTKSKAQIKSSPLLGTP